MPKAAKKAPPKQTAAPTTPVASPTPLVPLTTAPVKYDKVSILEFSSTSPHGPLTVEDMKLMLDWETEKEWQARMVAEEGGKPEHYLFGEIGPIRKDNKQHQPIHCLNSAKEKVVCWNNANNRPFDMGWCEALVHTILAGQWAGPLMVPGETVNGETVRVSKYGRVLSGQHQGTALILADETLALSRANPNNAADPKYPAWNGHDHPVLETIVITGLSEDERVLRTIDYVKPRTTADMLYTMPVFRENTPVQRKEMTRMLSTGIDTLWTRTKTQGYRTHPEVVGFLERHKTLLKCVDHLFVENAARASADGGRKISKLRLSAGQCAALCYLMGSSNDNGDEQYGDRYRNESPPSEHGLDWKMWDRARKFWALLAGDRGFMPVRMALGRLVDSEMGSEDNQGLGGRVDEKLAIIALAWEHWVKEELDPPFTDEDLVGPDGVLCLHYTPLDDKGNKLPEGQVKLIEVADFKGIDCPDSIGKGGVDGKGVPEPPPPTPTEMARMREEADARRRAAAGHPPVSSTGKK